MTYGQLVMALAADPGLAGSSVSPEHAVQQALRDIQMLDRWSCMRATTVVDAGPGALSVDLPDNFARLRACYLVASDGAVGPRLEVTSQSDPGVGPESVAGRVSLVFGPTGWQLRFPDTLTEAVRVRVEYDGFLPELVNATDTNWFTENAPEVVLWMARRYMYAVLGDAKQVAVAAAYLRDALRAAQLRDADSALRGTWLQMGG